MHIVIAGGSGFLGKALTAALLAGRHERHQVVVLSRGDDDLGTGARSIRWSPEDGAAGPWAKEIDGADAVINLAGAGIADRRWNHARKQLLRDSRLRSTRSLVDAIRLATRKPGVFIQGSAVGYYGAFDDGPELHEGSPPGSDFLGQLCAAWEAEARPLAEYGCRIVWLRTGIVLSKMGGALPKLLTPFRWFAGGPIGSGRQYMSWIHLDDWIAMVIWALENPSVSGSLNATAPNPVTNAELSHAIGRAIHRPSWAPVPGVVLRLIVGDFATDGLLRGQRVVPVRARELGFTFRYEHIDEALAAAVAM